MLLIPDPSTRPDGPVHRGAHPGPDLQRQGPDHGQGLQPRSPLRGPEGRGVRQEERGRGHHLHRPRAGVLLLRLDPLRPELQLRLLLHRLRGGRLEQRPRGHAGPPEPRLQAALQAGLLPGAADGPVPGHPLRHGAGARSRSACGSRCTTTRWPPAGRPRSTCASTRSRRWRTRCAGTSTARRTPPRSGARPRPSCPSRSSRTTAPACTPTSPSGRTARTSSTSGAATPTSRRCASTTSAAS